MERELKTNLIKLSQLLLFLLPHIHKDVENTVSALEFKMLATHIWLIVYD